MLDKDNNSLLNIDEIKIYFGGNEQTWKEILKDVDENVIGKLILRNFKKL